MARDPGSLWLPLAEASSQGAYAKNKFIVHSTGSNGTAKGTWRYFANSNVEVESTFIVGQGPWDPTIQCLDSSARADANIAANDEGISVEVVGDGQGGYNSWQRAEIIRLGIWAHRTHGIPLQIIPSAAQDSGGYGWHIMFGSPGPWTSVVKICPGPVRIKELKEDIFPAIWRGEEDDDFMGLYNSRAELRTDVHNATWLFPQWTVPGTDRKENPAQFLVAARALAEAAAKGAGLDDAEIKRIVEGVTAEMSEGWDLKLEPKAE